MSDFRSAVVRLRPPLLDGGRALAAAGRRDAAAGELSDALGTFLVSWERVAPPDDKSDGEGAESSIRTDGGDDDGSWLRLSREAISLLLEAYGPGDVRVRSAVLSILSALNDLRTRQVLLDALPYCLPPPPTSRVSGKDVTLNAGGVSTARDEAAAKDVHRGAAAKAADEVVSALRELHTSDHNALLPVLGALSQLLPSLPAVHRSEAFQLCQSSLRVVPLDDLPAVITALLKCVNNQEQGAEAIRDIREEWSLIMEEYRENVALGIGTVQALVGRKFVNACDFGLVQTPS